MDPSSPFVHPDVPIELDSPPGRRPKVSLSVLLAHIREKRDPILDVIYNSPARSVATTVSFSHDADNPNSRRSSRRFSSFLVTSTSAKNRHLHRLNSSTWSESSGSDSDEDAYALLSAVTASSISSTTRRSIGGTAVKKKLKMGFDPPTNHNHNSSTTNGGKVRSTSLGDGKPPDDPDITTCRASSLGAIGSCSATAGSSGGSSTKSSRKPSLHLASDGPPVLPPLNIFTSGKRRNSSLGSLGFSRRRSSQQSHHQLQQQLQQFILVDNGPPPRPPPLIIPNKGGAGEVGDTHLRKKRPRAFMPVSPREVYLRLYGDDGGGGGGLGCDDAGGGVCTKFDDSSGGNGSMDKGGSGHFGPPSSYPLPVRTDTRKGSASSLRRKSKRGSDPHYHHHHPIPPDKKPSIGAAGTSGPPGRRRGSSKHSQRRKKSLQSCWFDDDETDMMMATAVASAADATEESDMDLDLLGPLSPPAFSKKKKGVAGSRLTPSKRSAENINLFDPFFSFSRRCVTAPIRNIGPLDNWLSDTLNNHN
ncbi:hypothetical protein CPB86DRAFT_875827 [Serendipita vermifera]|nr:hypothetical protein CPB86DRAFT_875827 [Serendipita vermifera]